MQRIAFPTRVQGVLLFGKKKKKRCLKVGLLQTDRPAIERKLKVKEKVTIGPDAKNTFVIPSVKLPKKFVVFKPQGDRYILNFLPGMAGKIAVGGNALSLTTLVQRGIVDTKKGIHSVSISDKTRGKLIFDNVRLLFRFEEA